MDPRSKRRWTYVATAVIGAIIIIAAILLLQQPLQNKTTPPSTQKSPPFVTTGAASGVTTTAATLNGNVGLLGTASTVTVGFLYGTSASLAGAANVSGGSESAAGGYSRSLSGLTANTTYFVAAWGLGDGFATGNVVSFRTQATPSNPQAHAPSVATNAASHIRNISATLNGDLTDLGTASSVTVGFLYATDPTLAGALNASAGGETSTTIFTLVIGDLTPNTTYYAQAWALGDGFANGSTVAFTTAASPSGPGNGHHVPPGWAHARCPDVPERAPAHGVRARCLYNETYGEWKKEHPSNGLALTTPSPSDLTTRTQDPDSSGPSSSYADV